jgi:DNA polymerase-1
MQQLLFAPFNKRGKKPTEAELASGSYEWEFPQNRAFRVENLSNFVKDGSERALKFRDMIITGMGLEPISFTASGMPQADTPVIKKLAGKSPSQGKYGLAYEHFKKLGQEEEGI